MIWPETTRTLCGGWKMGERLVSPEGQPFGPDHWLSIPEVAALRGIGPNSLAGYLSKGQPSAGQGWERFGKRWQIRASDAVRA